MSRFWSGEDVQAGLCDWTQVGTPKPDAPAPDPEPPPTPPYKSVKDSFEAAFRAIGGVEALARWARDNPNKFFPLMPKLLGPELALFNVNQDITIIHALPPPRYGSAHQLNLSAEQIIAALRLLPDHERELVRLAVAPGIGQAPAQEPVELPQTAPDGSPGVGRG